MVTPQDVESGIAIFAAIQGIAKRLTGLAQKNKDSELLNLVADMNLKIANANLELANVINQLADVKTENTELKQRLKELEDSLEPTNQLILGDDGLFYKQGETRPYCPGCYSERNKQIPLQDSQSSFKRFGSYRCTVCNKYAG